MDDYLGAPADVPGRPERARPDWLRRHPKGYWFAVGAVCLGALMSQLDTGMVTVAYPTLHRAFKVPLSSVVWVGLSTLLTVVATLVAFGKRADMWGRKRVYVDGFVVFIAGAVAAALAQSFAWLLAARVVEGIGVAMVQANSVALVTASVPRERRAAALGLQGTAQAAGLALGPLVGGLVLAELSWRWVFVASVPIALLALPAALLFIPRSRDLRPLVRLDLVGAGLIGVAAVGIIGGFTQGARYGWSGAAPLFLGIGVVAALALFPVERRIANPLLDLRALRDRRVSSGLVTATLTYLSFFGALVAAPFYVEALGHSPATAGVVTMALPLGLAVIAPFAGRLRRHVAERVAIPLSFVVVALGLAFAARSSSLAAVSVGLAVAGVGLGTVNTMNNVSIMQGVAATDRGAASALVNMVRALGTALGLALVTTLLSTLGGPHHANGPRGAMTALVVAPVLSAAICLAMLPSRPRAAPVRSR
ncbi:MAG TPA: MFS transporter [Acidimicrobiales bacterium]